MLKAFNDVAEAALAEAKAFADRTGLREQFDKQLAYLDTYGHDPDPQAILVTLWKDFAPYSFAFRIDQRQPDGSYQPWFNGGLIYFGPGDTGASGPQYSVRVGDTSQAGWSIHT